MNLTPWLNPPDGWSNLMPFSWNWKINEVYVDKRCGKWCLYDQNTDLCYLAGMHIREDMVCFVMYVLNEKPINETDESYIFSMNAWTQKKFAHRFEPLFPSPDGTYIISGGGNAPDLYIENGILSFQRS